MRVIEFAPEMVFWSLLKSLSYQQDPTTLEGNGQCSCDFYVISTSLYDNSSESQTLEDFTPQCLCRCNRYPLKVFH